MTININFDAKRKLHTAIALVAVSLSLGCAAFAQQNPDGSMPIDPGVNGNQMSPGAPGGPWGGGGGGRKRHMRQGIGQGQGGQDPAKREARRQKMLKKFDANGDGQLDQNEMAQAKAFREQRRAQRQAQGMGNGQMGGPQGMNPMGQMQGMPGMPGMGRKHKGGIRGGHHRWQQDGQSMQGQGLQGMPQGPGPGQMPPQGYPNDPNAGMPTNPNGVGQIQPFQNIPQQQ